jgi:hypothetical protein
MSFGESSLLVACTSSRHIAILSSRETDARLCCRRLSVDMPEEDLPAKLDDYLTAYRGTPGFHPFEYVFRDILTTQPDAAAALAEREAAKAREEEAEKAANGGYSGWKAVARKAFIESDPLPTVEKEKVKPTDPSLSRTFSTALRLALPV